ncbi:MAG TPA: hypothetical protein VGI19_01050 [Candidatus Cybelea sp.]|jgi:hypothetical protein
MSACAIWRRLGAPLVLALTIGVTGCVNHAAASVVSPSPSAPVYPNAQIETAGTSGPGAAYGQAFSTDSSFDTVYAWYKKNLPGGSERSLVRFPEKSAFFFVGPVPNGLSVTITAPVVCCKTLIVIAQAKS